MDKYCRMLVDIADDDAYISSVDMPSTEREILLEGRKLDEQIKISFAVKNRTKRFNDLLSHGLDIRVVSDKFRKLLENFGGGQLQFVPVKLEKKEYWLLNILNLIPAFDWDKSTYTSFGEPPVLNKITHLVLKEELLEGINIFRLKEQPFQVFVSKQLHDAILENKITGVEFVYTMDLTKRYDS